MGRNSTLRGYGPFTKGMQGKLDFSSPVAEGTQVMALIAVCQTTSLSNELLFSLGEPAIHGDYAVLSSQNVKENLPHLKDLYEEDRLEYFDYKGLEEAVEAGWVFFYSVDG